MTLHLDTRTSRPWMLLLVTLSQQSWQRNIVIINKRTVVDSMASITHVFEANSGSSINSPQIMYLFEKCECHPFMLSLRI